jgi:peptide/nickel transport system permease protein
MPEDVKQTHLEYLGELRRVYGLDRSILARYGSWISRIITKGEFGYSFQSMRPVSELILERLGWTLLMSGVGLAVRILVGFVLGVYSATHQYSAGDHAVNALVFLGMATPDFFLALVFMTIVVFAFRQPVGGLLSSEYLTAPWNLAKVWDLIKHLSLPIAVGLVTGAGGTIRVIRGNLLDKLGQQYVQTARAKGLPERIVIYRHALRNALHPWVMGMGGIFSALISGDTTLSIVLGLPTVGYMFYTALIQQDSYVAGTFLLLTTMLLQAGNLVADIALAWLDPTIRFE